MAAPTITSFTPTSGAPGDPIVITGVNFTGATAVKFDGFPALAYVVDSDTQITVNVPTGSQDGLITVVTPGGSVDSSTSFDVTTVGPGGIMTPDRGAGGVCISIAFDQSALATSPDWTDVTALAPNLVAGYDLQRGRQFELDYTDTGSYSIKIYDRDGVLDPTNLDGPLWGWIEPDLQVLVELWNPVSGEWSTRFRGWLEDFDYDVTFVSLQGGNPTGVQTLTITCYDIFALLSLIEMQPYDPAAFGVAAFTGSEGNICYGAQTFLDRISDVLGDAGVPVDYYVLFTGNVNMTPTVYSPGDTPMNVIQDALDAEFPGVSNAYPDRYGRLCAHGRMAKFTPEVIAAGAGNDAWDFRSWRVGDGAAIAGDSRMVQLRPPYSWNRGRSKIINSALCYPATVLDGSVYRPFSDPAHAGEMQGQYWKDDTSIALRGYMSWSRENVQIDNSILTGNYGDAECLLFSKFYVANYSEPKNRITALTIKSIHPLDARAARVWQMLSKADIADKVSVTVSHPGGGGFDAAFDKFYIEGVTETVEPLTADYAMVTMSLDVSPASYFADPVGLDGI